MDAAAAIERLLLSEVDQLEKREQTTRQDVVAGQ